MKKESRNPSSAFFWGILFLKCTPVNHKQTGPLGFHCGGVCSQDYCQGIPSEEKSLLLE